VRTNEDKRILWKQDSRLGSQTYMKRKTKKRETFDENLMLAKRPKGRGKEGSIAGWRGEERF